MAKLLSLLIAAVLVGIALPRASAQTVVLPYCAYEVLVRSSANKPRDRVEVTAVSDGSKFQASTTTDINGLARFCDPPLDSYVDIQIGVRRCFVTVNRVYPLWRKTRRLLITYQPCASDGGQGLCRFVVRVRDPQDHPVADARLSGKFLQGMLVSDELGRIFASLPWRIVVDANLERIGYVSERVPLECGPELIAERVVVLKVQ